GRRRGAHLGELRPRRGGEGARGGRTRRRERGGRRGLPRGPSEESPRRDPLRELIPPPRGLVGWGHIPWTRDCQSIKECLTKSFIVRAVDAAFEQRKEVRMKILLVGSGGHVGGVARAELEKRGHDVIGATRSTDPGVDTSDADSISKLLEAV